MNLADLCPQDQTSDRSSVLSKLLPTVQTRPRIEGPEISGAFQ